MDDRTGEELRAAYPLFDSECDVCDACVPCRAYSLGHLRLHVCDACAFVNLQNALDEGVQTDLIPVTDRVQ
jgi:hypothetical protein